MATGCDPTLWIKLLFTNDIFIIYQIILQLTLVWEKKIDLLLEIKDEVEYLKNDIYINALSLDLITTLAQNMIYLVCEVIMILYNIITFYINSQ